MSDNSTLFPFKLCQHSMWYLIAGIEQYLESADMECQIDTIERELNRVFMWDSEHGGFFDPENYEGLWARIAERRAEIQQWDREWYAEKNRENFTLVNGGKS